MEDINDRAERQYEEEEEWKMAGKTVKPSFFYNDTDRLEIFLYRSVIGVGRDHRSWMRNLQRRVLDR